MRGRLFWCCVLYAIFLSIPDTVLSGFPIGHMYLGIDRAARANLRMVKVETELVTISRFQDFKISLTTQRATHHQKGQDLDW